LFRSKAFQLGLALALGLVVFLLPRPEGTRFRVSGDEAAALAAAVSGEFSVEPVSGANGQVYVLAATRPGEGSASGARLQSAARELDLDAVRIDYMDGLSPKAMRFLAVVTVLLVLFVLEPIPLEITAICIGVSLAVLGIVDVKMAWAPYMHPVVVFIMCCLIFAISLEKAGITTRLGHFIIKKAGNNVVRFTFVLACGLGLASSVFHDAAACAIGLVTMMPLMRAVGIRPHTDTARFMIIALAFACSCGGMGTLVGGGRCMVSAAFLEELTGIEITFFDWIKFAMPAALVTVPASVGVVWLVFRPDPTLTLPSYEEEPAPWTAREFGTLAIIGATFLLWLTKSLHGIDYSVTGMLGVSALVLTGILTWDDIQKNLEWGTALFIFGGGISLGLAMAESGAADYFAHLFFPYVRGGGWLLLFVGVGLFGALVTNAMANVAAAALILPIVIPMAQMEGVDPRVLALCLGMSTSFAMLLIIGCPPNAIAYGSRFFKASDLTRAGALATPVLLAILVLVASLWWKVLGLV
jgi:sodium-dependent dicarboxylate transporter 2/3/5